MTATAGHVFISHGSEDRDEANALSAFIEARGIRTWIAPRDVRPGKDYSEQLQQALEQCTAFVVLVTGKANSSPYVRAETEMAFSNNKPIFPVRQSDIQPAAGLAFFLKIRHWTDAFGKHGDAAMERLGRELDVVCGVAETTVAPEPAAALAQPPPPPAPVVPTAPPMAPPAAPSASAPIAVPQPLPAWREERLVAAIGPNAARYLEKWQRMQQSGTWLSWNWPAFLATLFWFAYRRMWIALAVGVAIFFLTDLVVGRSPAFVIPGWIFLLAMCVVSGAVGNALYRRQTDALVAKADGLDQPVALAQIRAQGGTSVPGLASCLAVFLVLFIAAAVAQIRAPRPVQPNAPVQTEQPAAPAQVEQPAAPVQPEQTPQTAPATTVDSAFLVGRWSDNNECGSMFNSDGTFSANDGSRGYWNLSGDRLTLTGNTTLILQVTATDQNNLTLVNPDGSVIRATRC